MYNDRNPFIQALEPTPAQLTMSQSQLNSVLRKTPNLCKHGFTPSPNKWIPIGEGLEQSVIEDLRARERSELAAMATTFARMVDWLVRMQFYKDWNYEYTLWNLYTKEWEPYAAMVYGDCGTMGLLAAAAIHCGCRIVDTNDANIAIIYIDGFLRS